MITVEDVCACAPEKLPDLLAAWLVSNDIASGRWLIQQVCPAAARRMP